MAALTGLLVSPISWDHHWVWIAPGALVAAHYAVQAWRRPPERTAWALGILAAGIVAWFGAWPARLFTAKLNLGNDSLGLLWIPRNTNPVYYQWYGDKRWFTEYHWHALALIAGNAYVLAGLALFGLLGALALLLPHRTRSMPMSLAPEPELREVCEDVYAYLQPDGSWYLNNTGFLVSNTGVISVDATSTERRTRAYLDAIATVTEKPVRTLVNTHHHGDHTHGNYLMSGATIVGHERCREAILASPIPPPPGIWSEVDWGHLEPAPPFLTYTDGVTLWSGDLRCEVRYVGTPAHTTNDSIVYIPDRDVLFAGDLLFNGGTPFALMGSVSGWIEVLETVLRPLGARTIVPGHGPVCGPEVIDDVLAYLRFVQDLARAAKAAGLTPLEAARQADLGGFKDLLDAERVVGNLHRAYLELNQGERGAPVDLARALGDMVAYNGGQPLTCHA